MAPPRNRRTGFSRRAQYGFFLSYVAAVIGAIIGAVMLIASAFHPAGFAAVRSMVAEVTTPVSSALDAIRRGIVGIPEGIGHHFNVVDENATLRRQVQDERGIVLRARTLGRENARLRALLRVRDAGAQPVVTARVVSSTASSARRFGVLNAGRFQGVRPGQPLRGPEGLIGRVLETGLNSARVLLIIDPESIVPVRRTRDGLPAIATGRGDGMIDIRSAGSAEASFQAGDAFVTSGTGGLYPPDIAVARIVRPARDVGLARAYADPDALDFAFVLAPFMPEPPPLPVPEKRK